MGTILLFVSEVSKWVLNEDSPNEWKNYHCIFLWLSGEFGVLEKGKLQFSLFGFLSLCLFQQIQFSL